jgi:hypothetical protein
MTLVAVLRVFAFANGSFRGSEVNRLTGIKPGVFCRVQQRSAGHPHPRQHAQLLRRCARALRRGPRRQRPEAVPTGPGQVQGTGGRRPADVQYIVPDIYQVLVVRSLQRPSMY